MFLLTESLSQKSALSLSLKNTHTLFLHFLAFSLLSLNTFLMFFWSGRRNKKIFCGNEIFTGCPTIFNVLLHTNNYDSESIRTDTRQNVSWGEREKIQFPILVFFMPGFVRLASWLFVNLWPINPETGTTHDTVIPKHPTRHLTLEIKPLCSYCCKHWVFSYVEDSTRLGSNIKEKDNLVCTYFNVHKWQ